jgi:hypothetical protein
MSHNEINNNNNNNNKHPLKSNAKIYGGKTHLTHSKNSDTTASRAVSFAVLAPGGWSVRKLLDIPLYFYLSV